MGGFGREVCFQRQKVKGMLQFRGKLQGKPITQVLKEENPAITTWMMKGDFPLDTEKKNFTQVKLRGFQIKK